MQVYTVHYHPFAPDPDRDVTLLREGFSWTAFLFTGLWALWNRLWLPAVVLIAVAIALELVGEFGFWDTATGLAATLGFQVFVGLNGNDWKRAKLERDGYLFAGVVAAPNRDSALRRFFDLNPGAAMPQDG